MMPSHRLGKPGDPSPEPHGGGLSLGCWGVAWTAQEHGGGKPPQSSAGGPNPLGPSEPGAPGPALRRLQRGSAGQKGVPSGRWTSLQGKRPPPPGLRGVHRPAWGRILRSPLSPSAPPLWSTTPEPPPDSRAVTGPQATWQLGAPLASNPGPWDPAARPPCGVSPPRGPGGKNLSSPEGVARPEPGRLRSRSVILGRSGVALGARWERTALP